MSLVRSYLVDVRSLVTAHWVIPWVVFPLAGFAVFVYAATLTLYDPALARYLTTFYGIVGTGLVLAILALSELWTHVLRERVSDVLA